MRPLEYGRYLQVGAYSSRNGRRRPAGFRCETRTAFRSVREQRFNEQVGRSRLRQRWIVLSGEENASLQ